MPDDLESLYDLIETRAAQHGIPQRKVCEWALTAILNGALRYEFSNQWIVEAEHPFPGDNETRVAFSDEYQRGSDGPLRKYLIPGVLSELKNNSDLIGWGWSRQLMIAPTVFDQWLKGHLSPSGPKQIRHRGSRGPQKGTIDRCSAADRALFPEMKRLIPQYGSAHAAALHLATEGKVTGRKNSSVESKARRLARTYLAETR